MGFGTFSFSALSSETCRARAVGHATRSVACARTTEHLATKVHRKLEYDGDRCGCQIELMPKIRFGSFDLLILPLFTASGPSFLPADVFLAAGAAPGAVTILAVLMESSLGQPLSRYGLALLFDLALIGAAATRRAFAVPGIQSIDHVHAVGDLRERSEAHAIEAWIIGQVDENCVVRVLAPRWRTSGNTSCCSARPDHR